MKKDRTLAELREVICNNGHREASADHIVRLVEQSFNITWEWGVLSRLCKSARPESPKAMYQMVRICMKELDPHGKPRDTLRQLNGMVRV